jgi:hypothetical protein
MLIELEINFDLVGLSVETRKSSVFSNPSPCSLVEAEDIALKFTYTSLGLMKV